MPEWAVSGEALPTMPVSAQLIESTLKALAFEGAGLQWTRTFDSYPVVVTFDPASPITAQVDFGTDIKLKHASARSLARQEGLVVLECVCRLLSAGYKPARIELEPTWKLGHKGKGRLDILLKTPTGQPYAMIECKNWGEDYANERNNLLEDGGQLFSYFVQERKVAGLYLYCSKAEDGTLPFQTEWVDTSALSGSSVLELFESWDKTLLPLGLFTVGHVPYDSQYKNLTLSDLRALDRSAGKGLFNSFAEILRRHVLSDKSNAFNKIFNLFVCKISDEDEATPATDTAFQWKIGDSDLALLQRLGALYRKGLKSYLDIQVDDEFFNATGEFAFIDVYDDKSHRRNATVVREVVQLLQGYRLKYSAKHQFLGDFFESLLNTGLKQESGQFFTPVPLARFIVRSLPLQNIISRKVNAKASHVLPYLIDFACGSGHFITEAIDEIDQFVGEVDTTTLTSNARARFIAESGNLLWAKEYIYGIEEDYRLAKTTKIATFMNGDGDATIVRADGLDDFYQSKEYRGRLRATSPRPAHPVFDVVVSNPPFAVPNFLSSLPDADGRFTLAKHLGLKSSEIECLFIERAAQLLSAGGALGIILPLSVLNSSRPVHVGARTLLLRDFVLHALVELRDRAFSASTSATVVVFATRRDEAVIKAQRARIKAALEDGDETLDPALVAANQHLGARFERAVELLEDDVNAKSDDIDAIVAFTFTHGTSVLAAFPGDGKEMESFLGYRFSSGRGSEGIHWHVDGDGNLQSKLYDPKDVHNARTLSTVVRSMFDSVPSIDESLKPYAKVVQFESMLDGPGFALANPSALLFEQAPIHSNSPFGDFIFSWSSVEQSFGELIDSGEIQVLKGLIYGKQDESPAPTASRVLTADNIDLRTGEVVFPKVRYLRPHVAIPGIVRPKQHDILISIASGSLKHLGKVAYVREDVDAAAGGFLSIIRCNDDRVATVLFYNLLSRPFREYVSRLKDQNINNLSPTALRKAVVMMPTDLDGFLVEARAREAQLQTLRKMQSELSTPAGGENTSAS